MKHVRVTSHLQAKMRVIIILFFIIKHVAGVSVARGEAMQVL